MCGVSGARVLVRDRGKHLEFQAPCMVFPTCRQQEAVSQQFFRSFGGGLSSTFHPGLAPWAAFLRRFAAESRNAIRLS